MFPKFLFIIEILVLTSVNSELYSDELNGQYSAQSYENNMMENKNNYDQDSYKMWESDEREPLYEIESSYETRDEADCQKSDHLTAVEGNCYKFKMCANGILTIMDCPVGLVFDSNLKICNNKENVSGKCGLMRSEYY